MMKNSETFKVEIQGDREIVISRVFDAPRELVFKAMTTSEFVRRWLLGPPGWTMPVCEIDLKVGGKYRYEWRHADGMAMAMHGIHREVVPPKKIVCTQLFDDDWTAGEAVGTMVLSERDGITHLTNTVQYASREARDAVLKTPMDEGMAAGYNRLEEVLSELLNQ